MIRFVTPGKKIKAPFGNRSLQGYILRISDKSNFEDLSKIKDILTILDIVPLFDAPTLAFYEWLADHYLSNIGEVLKLADPFLGGIKVEKKIKSDKEHCQRLFEDESDKTSNRAKLLKLCSNKDILTLSSIKKNLDVKNISSLLNTLQKAGAITISAKEFRPKAKEKTEKYLSLVLSAEEIYSRLPELDNRSPKLVELLLKLINLKKKEYQISKIIRELNIARNFIDSLEKKGFIKVYSKHVERKFNDSYSEALKTLTLTEKQQVVVDIVAEKIESSKFCVTLLHGVTGSGKTQVYIELIKKTLDLGKNVLILVPEISLTPQMTARLKANFGDKVTVLHSHISLGEKFDSWQNIIKGEIRIVTGPRSALFSPLKNIGIIIIDEEHDSSYKQNDISPKYHARDSAIMKAKFIGCPVLLGSATPSIESMYNAETGKYKLIELRDRVDNAQMPKIVLINVIEEKKKKMMENVFSKILLEKIADRLRKKEGVIILQNRRGYSTQVYCFECGELEMCINCSVSMVYHINQHIMQCHYCGYTANMPKTCNHCGSKAIKFFGAGTERVEEELEYYFPGTKTRRIDSDTISKKGELAAILTDFGKGETDILVGTQMVSKGLDFSRVSLVGVISAESNLWLPDFRADEKTFQLLTQVSGRAGRSQIPGEVIIQTQNEKNFVLRKVKETDYKGFYEKEKMLRETRSYPPFANMCLVEVKHKDEELAKKAIAKLYSELYSYKKFINVTPPALAAVAKVKQEYRFHILIRSAKSSDPSGSTLRHCVKEAYLKIEPNALDREMRISFDINPYSVV